MLARSLHEYLLRLKVPQINLQSALENVSRSKSALKKTIGSLRKIATDLSPANLDAIGLPNALREYFSNIERQTKIKIDFSNSIWDGISQNAWKIRIWIHGTIEY